MVTLGELLNEPVEEREDILEDKWWQYDIDNWAGVVYDSKGNIVSVRDEYGNWSPFQIQEVAATHDQELVHVQDQEVKNINDQEGENVEDETNTSIKTKRVMGTKDDVEVEGVKSGEHDCVNSGKNESRKGLVSNMGKGLGLKRPTMEDEDEHQKALKHVKSASAATGNIVATSHGGHGV
nr:hypothetical protein [Tanacetum cinerariifolium]